MSDLVSVLTPTYNCGKYIHRLLDSVLKQTYPAIEMYVMDDGSTDDTRSVIDSYIPRFEEKGYSLHYRYHENQGQSGAINDGLKLVKGDYLVWPDADDFYKTDNAIEVMVDSLKNSADDVGMTRVLLEYLKEEDLTLARGLNQPGPYSDRLFEDCLFKINGFWYCAGGYMVKTAVLKAGIPDLEIYTEHDAGQNWQLMLPVLYTHRCLTIPQVMYSVLTRSSSHSRGQYATRKQVNRQYNGYRNTILATLKKIPSMPAAELTDYCRRINRQYDKMVMMNNLRCFLRPITPYIKRMIGKHD